MQSAKRKRRKRRPCTFEPLEQRLLMIVGGQVADPGEAPWMVAVTDRSGFQFCGGAVVADEWVVTAAHCVAGRRPQNIRVAAVDRLASAPSHSVKRIVTHPDYDPRSLDADIALLKTRVGLGAPALRPVPPRNAGKLAQPRDAATVYGFGAISQGGPGSERLRKVDVPIVSNRVANRPTWYDGEVTDNMITAGRKRGGVDSCQGDSGGPLVVANHRGQPRLAGIVSWGIGCARPKKPGVYTRVSNFVHWLRDVISGSRVGDGPTDAPLSPRARSDAHPGPAGEQPEVTPLESAMAADWFFHQASLPGNDAAFPDDLSSVGREPKARAAVPTFTVTDVDGVMGSAARLRTVSSDSRLLDPDAEKREPSGFDPLDELSPFTMDQVDELAAAMAISLR